MKFLILPGLYNSGPQHWQSLWENSLVNAVRVQQLNWDAPERDAWVHALSSA
ncbi:MAG: alpha/beta hydrolase, partial [Burkholderiales bacterium]|nr:alpha/beta hydrolase [Burkholderiales bacterium]